MEKLKPYDLLLYTLVQQDYLNELIWLIWVAPKKSFRFLAYNICGSSFHVALHKIKLTVFLYEFTLAQMLPVSNNNWATVEWVLNVDIVALWGWLKVLFIIIKAVFITIMFNCRYRFFIKKGTRCEAWCSNNCEIKTFLKLKSSIIIKLLTIIDNCRNVA